MPRFLISLWERGLSCLPVRVRQQSLWRAVNHANPRQVLRWLRSGAAPDLPAALDPALFAIHIPIQAAVVNAAGAHWKGSTVLVVRLLMRRGAKPDFFHHDGQLSPTGKSCLVAGVPGWVILGGQSSNLARSLDQLLSIWSWRAHRASPAHLMWLLRFRHRTTLVPVADESLDHLFSRAPRTVLEVVIALFSPLGPGAMAGVVRENRAELLPLFSGQEVEWDKVRKRLDPSSSQRLPDYRIRHDAVRDQQQMEADTALVINTRPRAVQRL